MEPEIVPADKRLRTWTLVAAAVILAAGAAVLAVLHRDLRALQQAEDDQLDAAVERVEQWMSVVTWTGAAGFVGAGAWMFALGWRINRAERFPLPGMRVVRATRVRTGAAARTVAAGLQLASFACIAAGVLGIWWLHRLADVVLHPPGR